MGLKKINFEDALPPEEELVLITDNYDGYVLRCRVEENGNSYWYDEHDNLDDSFYGSYSIEWEYWSHLEFDK